MALGGLWRCLSESPLTLRLERPRAVCARPSDQAPSHQGSSLRSVFFLLPLLEYSGISLAALSRKVTPTTPFSGDLLLRTRGCSLPVAGIFVLYVLSAHWVRWSHLRIIPCCAELFLGLRTTVTKRLFVGCICLMSAFPRLNPKNKDVVFYITVSLAPCVWLVI